MPASNQVLFVIILVFMSIIGIFLNQLSAVDVMKGRKVSIIMRYFPDITMVSYIYVAFRMGVWIPLAADILIKRFLWNPVRYWCIDKFVVNDMMGTVEAAMDKMGVDSEDSNVMVVGSADGKISQLVVIGKDGKVSAIDMGKDNEEMQALPDDMSAGKVQSNSEGVKEGSDLPPE